MINNLVDDDGNKPSFSTVVLDIPWTTKKLEQELYLDLMKVRNGENHRKYEGQAKHLMYKIPVYKPVPSFIINLGDLSNKVKVELRSLDAKSLNYVMKEAVCRVFENIDECYFLLNVKKLLKWELLP
jgi:hypothetical protein